MSTDYDVRESGLEPVIANDWKKKMTMEFVTLGTEKFKLNRAEFLYQPHYILKDFYDSISTDLNVARES